ncbi:hypothetical protein K437DRAFT_260551 [Tilletiaria anomala UBC 951]|uniref:Uncharacterized protein n=1 Tax=Tilletiaria anomala (strain ATCC 24038 / CBS 436.72 / UBC 951) TaxID=1037660 RepID=A0A066WM12_TILAU|nr:uncharacterized protein K437DRAFT_260551 [Tilletiaria anomala UBC 951]KDN53638.1 hypothetical protein K437DRAFT_260551 [Tilletiaria anomala UBC 951]
MDATAAADVKKRFGFRPRLHIETSNGLVSIRVPSWIPLLLILTVPIVQIHCFFAFSTILAVEYSTAARILVALVLSRVIGYTIVYARKGTYGHIIAESLSYEVSLVLHILVIVMAIVSIRILVFECALPFARVSFLHLGFGSGGNNWITKSRPRVLLDGTLYIRVSLLMGAQRLCLLRSLNFITNGFDEQQGRAYLGLRVQRCKGFTRHLAKKIQASASNNHECEAFLEGSEGQALNTAAATATKTISPLSKAKISTLADDMLTRLADSQESLPKGIARLRASMTLDFSCGRPGLHAELDQAVEVQRPQKQQHGQDSGAARRTAAVSCGPDCFSDAGHKCISRMRTSGVDLDFKEEYFAW